MTFIPVYGDILFDGSISELLALAAVTAYDLIYE